MPVRIVENKENKTVTAFLSGEIDHHGAKKMREEIDKAIDESLPSLLVLDFGEVSFMDSSGIGLVMGRYKKMRDLDGKIFIQNPSMHIKKVMRLAGLDKLAGMGDSSRKGVQA